MLTLCSYNLEISQMNEKMLCVCITITKPNLILITIDIKYISRVL